MKYEATKIFEGIASLDDHYKLLNIGDGMPWYERTESFYAGKFWRIDQETYDYFLSVLPPIQFSSSGFAISEAKTGCIHSAYFKIPGDDGTEFYSMNVPLDSSTAMTEARRLIIENINAKKENTVSKQTLIRMQNGDKAIETYSIPGKTISKSGQWTSVVGLTVHQIAVDITDNETGVTEKARAFVQYYDNFSTVSNCEIMLNGEVVGEYKPSIKIYLDKDAKPLPSDKFYIDSYRIAKELPGLHLLHREKTSSGPVVLALTSGGEFLKVSTWQLEKFEKITSEEAISILENAELDYVIEALESVGVIERTPNNKI